VLSNLTNLLIGAEYGSQAGQEIVGLDSVILIPAPASAALLCFGGVLAARRRR